MPKTLWKYSLAGLLVLVPAWITFLLFSTLFHALNELIDDLPWNIGAQQNPGQSLVLFLSLVVIVGAIATQVVGQRMISGVERWIEPPRTSLLPRVPRATGSSTPPRC